MKSTIQDLPIVISVALFGLVALVSICLLSFYGHEIPSEIRTLPAVALGILGGVVVGAKREIVEKDSRNVH